MQQVRLNKADIEIGKTYPIQVVHIAAKGIICKLQGNPDTEVTSFIHISKIANAYISDIHEYVAIGDKFNAVGISTDNGNELSLQHLNLKPKTSEPKSESYVKPKATLDEMIESANSHYKDKQGKKFQPEGKRRKPYKKPQFD